MSHPPAHGRGLSRPVCPQAVTTRAQAVTLLWRLEGCPAADTGLSYADVADTAWYREAVSWANAAGDPGHQSHHVFP